MEPISKKRSPLGQLRFTLLIFAIVMVTFYVILIRPHLVANMSTVVVELIIAVSVVISLVITLAADIIILIITLVTAALRHTETKTNVWLRKLKKTTRTAGMLILLFTIIVAGSQWLSYTPPIVGEDGKPLANSIAILEKVKLEDSDQWITIRGKDKDKPILLFLAGGPGGTQLAATRTQLKALEDYFIVVNWDQPGSGKSYSSVSKKSLTPERYISDAYELAKYLCKKFGKEKVYVLGESWGSALGIMLAQKHPEVIHAFMGTGQMVAFLDTEIYDYNFAMKVASENGDTEIFNKLMQQGAPPYYGKDVTWKSATYLMYLSSYMSKNPAISNSGYNTLGELSGPEYGLYDKLNYLRGVVYTFNHVYPQLYEIDLRKQAAKIDVPVYFLEGRHDVNAPTSLVEEYYQILQTPHKELIWFEHSGHDPWRNEKEKFVDTVVNLTKAKLN
jgi:pimeloyl-ACP methyl ester carboxylesterase